jgi:DNA mismatch repair protein MutS2
VDEKTLLKLEFDKIKEMLADCCGSTIGKEYACNLQPSSEIDVVDKGLRETTEAKEILRFNPSFSLGGFRNIRKQVERAGLGAILEPVELLDIAQTCLVSRKIKVFFTELKGNYPLIIQLGRNLGIFKSVETSINEAISSDGSILDTASEQIYTIRKKIRICQDRIRDKLESFIKNPLTAKYLQDSLVTIRGDRYVIPVKQEYRAQVPGLIHDQSASGATLFIEPMSVLELNNELKKLHAAEQQEILLILKALTRIMVSYTQDIMESLTILGNLDFIFAKAVLSQKMDAGQPHMNCTGNIKLKKARHPLIRGNVVPIDVDLGKDIDALVITGPNTGGKTVSLKTIGLLNVMALSGLHVPADEGTELSLFNNIYADIGDEQSIEQSLSTFSAHLVNIIRILRGAEKNTLVLLDELGAGTDPTEGSALAMSILEYLLQKQVKIVATTHYSELKVFAYNHPRIVNASVEFDVNTLKPTYKLLMGIPGKSNAFVIARGLGMPEKIIVRAGEFLTTDQVQVAELIENLEAERRISEQERMEAQRRIDELMEKERQLEEKEVELHNREVETIRKAQEESLRIIRKAREQTDVIFQQLKVVLDDEAKKAQNRALLKAQERIKKMEEDIRDLLPEERFIGQAPKKVFPGQYVKIPKLGQTGYVLSQPNQAGEVYVQAGIMKIMVKVEDLRVTEKPDKKRGEAKIGKLRREKIQSVSPKIDLRGKCASEAMAEMDKYLDDAFLAGLGKIRVIHGKGTGVLRDTITTYLKNHHAVKAYRLGDFNEGGTGVTIVELNK